jgi:hypothetical protein
MRILAFILAASSLAAAQQPPPRDTRTAPSTNAAPSGTGVLGGTVTGGDDGRPVRFAYVVLIGTTTGVVKVSSSDADGRFTFSSLPADRYTVGASKAPYLGAIAGARRPGRTGTPIAIAEGQKVTNVAIRMAMGGAIAGAIVDEKGQPASGTLVAILQWRMQGGERQLTQVPGVTITDELGRYRSFGLLPGEYVVVAMRTGSPQPTRALTAGEVDAALTGAPAPAAVPPPAVRYAPVYFPGTTRATEAASIILGVGEERANADFRLETVQTARVEGSVVTSDGQPVCGMAMLMTSVPGSVLGTAVTVRVTADGRFTATNVPPGPHVLTVNGQGPLAGQFARAVIETAGTDVFGIQLTMRPALTFSGRLAFDAAASPPSTSGRRIPIRPLGVGASSPGIGATNQSGVFTVTGVVPGRYVLGGPLAFGPTSDTMTWALQSVLVDGRDLTDLPIEITDTPPTNVVVTYTEKFQELSGRLQSQSGAPVSDYTIIVFPEDKAYWVQGTRRIVTTRPGTDGRFTLSGRGPTTLPPGKYLIAAVTDIGRDEQFDPAFLAQIVPAGIALTLGPGEKKTQDLAIK